MMRENVAKLVITSLSLGVILAISALMTLLVQYTIEKHGAFWPLFACILLLPRLVPRRRN